MAYLLIHVCTQNYWILTTTVEIIVGGWLVSFFDTHCSFGMLGLVSSGSTSVIGWEEHLTSNLPRVGPGAVNKWVSVYVSK